LPVRHHCLDLDDKKRARRSVAREDVDRSAFPEHGDRHFRQHRPPGSIEVTHDAFDRGSVRGIEQSVEALTLPRQAKLEARVHRSSQAMERTHREPVDAATLDPQDERL
jgi:hypothetical protein